MLKKPRNEPPMTTAYLNRIATAVPENDVHAAFIEFAGGMLTDPRKQNVFGRMVERAGIDHRYSCLNAGGALGAESEDESSNAYAFYRKGDFPNTAERMKMFERFAPVLLRKTLDRLKVSEEEARAVKHVLVTSCTGLYAPGLDFEIVDHLGLSPNVERTMIGFMGCYAAINALKLARHIVRSEPDAKVLVVNLELCTLHYQMTQDLAQVLAFLVFADGCAASLVSAEPVGVALDSFKAVTIPETRELITWKIRELGFDMMLSGQVPAELGKALESAGGEIAGDKSAIDLWAVHPGGRTILDAAESGLELSKDALWASREVLAEFGNMSSATIMFVLQRLMARAKSGERGCAMSFGPGLTAETMRFTVA